MDVDRRTLLGAATALPLASAPLAAAPAEDEWERIAREYDVTREVVQLEHGNWGMMARPVLAAYRARVERVNRDTSYYARRTMVADVEAARALAAEAMGVGGDEFVLTRNATEAMKALILQYNRLKAGEYIYFERDWGFTVDTGHTHVRYSFRTCWHGVDAAPGVRQCRTQWVDTMPSN